MYDGGRASAAVPIGDTFTFFAKNDVVEGRQRGHYFRSRVVLFCWCGVLVNLFIAELMCRYVFGARPMYRSAVGVELPRLNFCGILIRQTSSCLF